MAKPLQVVVVGITISKCSLLFLTALVIQMTKALWSLCLSIPVRRCIRITTLGGFALRHHFHH